MDLAPLQDGLRSLPVPAAEAAAAHDGAETADSGSGTPADVNVRDVLSAAGPSICPPITTNLKAQALFQCLGGQ